jgi:hypothetical protein
MEAAGGYQEQQIRYASQPEYLALEDKDILRDCASCSHILVGNFTGFTRTDDSN